MDSPAEHLLHRHLAQDLRRGEQFIGRDRQFTRAVSGAHPRAGHRHPAPTQAHRAVFAAVAHRDPALVVLALGSGQRGDVGVHQCLHDLQTGTHGQG